MQDYGQKQQDHLEQTRDACAQNTARLARQNIIEQTYRELSTLPVSPLGGLFESRTTGTLTQEEYLKRFEAVITAMLNTTRAKNSDYANPGDAFANFSLGPKMRPSISTADSIWIRMTDKFQRLASLLDRPAAVKDESLGDTLLDLANYAVILKIWLESRNA